LTIYLHSNSIEEMNISALQCQHPTDTINELLNVGRQHNKRQGVMSSFANFNKNILK